MTATRQTNTQESASRSANETASPKPPPQDPGDERPKRYSGRIGGLDIARCLAIFGMFYAHMAPRHDRYNLLADRAWVRDHPILANLPDGRSAILFAVLAGVSLAILTGRNVPYRGETMRTARLRIAGRAATLMVIAMVAGLFNTPVMIILSYYAVWFIIALPFTFWSPRKLFTLAAILAVVGPLVATMLPWLTNSLGLLPGTSSDSLFLWDILVTGSYPSLVYMAFVFTGMGIGRCDLGSKIVHARLVVSGAVLMVVGYGSSWLLSNWLIPSEGSSTSGSRTAPSTQSSTVPEGSTMPQGTYSPEDLQNMPGEILNSSGGSAQLGAGDGILRWNAYPLPETQDFVTAEPHTNTLFEAIGSGGFALAVLGLCLLAGGLARNVLYPVASVGSMALTAYVTHIFVIGLLTTNGTSWTPFVLLTVGLLVFSTLWRRFFARGPLEWVTWKVSMLAARMPMTRAERKAAAQDAAAQEAAAKDGAAVKNGAAVQDAAVAQDNKAAARDGAAGSDAESR